MNEQVQMKDQELKFICKNCGYIGEPLKKKAGNGALEIILWLLFIFDFFIFWRAFTSNSSGIAGNSAVFLFLVALIYSIWREVTHYNACPQCKSMDVIPIDSPIGAKLYKEVKGSEENKA
jgi:rubredoxin